jgi:hypothetical protein
MLAPAVVGLDFIQLVPAVKSHGMPLFRLKPHEVRSLSMYLKGSCALDRAMMRLDVYVKGLLDV